MRRTIDEIKESITIDFMNNESAANMFGFTAGDNFSKHFSKVSVINTLFYVFAAAAWVQEGLFDEHRREVEARIEQIMPHRPKWYRDRVLGFMKDMVLEEGTDRYDTLDMSEDQIELAKVVKHVVAAENPDASILTIKVAGETGGVRSKLDEHTETQLAAYIAEIKDAGVRISLVNYDPDIFNCEVDIFYNPLLSSETVEAACRAAIEDYIENLPFNGEYTNMALVDALQKVAGVKVVEFKASNSVPRSTGVEAPINARYTPEAGYFTAGTLTINMKAYE